MLKHDNLDFPIKNIANSSDQRNLNSDTDYNSWPDNVKNLFANLCKESGKNKQGISAFYINSVQRS